MDKQALGSPIPRLADRSGKGLGTGGATEEQQPLPNPTESENKEKAGRKERPHLRLVAEASGKEAGESKGVWGYTPSHRAQAAGAGSLLLRTITVG